MFPKPKPSLKPNTYAYESEPMVKATGFREYDARWLFGSEINLMGVEALGLGLGTLIHELGVKPHIVTGHDFRSYSASIKMALINGLLAAGWRDRIAWRSFCVWPARTWSGCRSSPRPRLPCWRPRSATCIRTRRSRRPALLEKAS